MQLPAGFVQYLISHEYNQGSLITARANELGNEILQYKGAVEQGTMTEQQNQAFKAKGELYKLAIANVGGVCQCLSVKWLKLKMKERLLKQTGKKKVAVNDRVDRLRLEHVLEKAMRRQTASSEKQLYTMAFEEVLKLYHVSAIPGWDRQISLKQLTTLVKSKTHAYFVIESCFQITLMLIGTG